MAGTTTASRRTAMPGSDVNDAIINLNKLVDDVEVIRGISGAEGITLLRELHDDHATQKTLNDELIADHAIVKTALDLIKAAAGDGLLQIATLAISAGDATDFKTTTIAYWRRLGIQFTKAATDTLSFTNADTINTAAGVGSFWGIWLVQISDTGTITTKSPAADQVYASEAAAIAALPAADAGNVGLGYIIINANDDSAWTANTDDMTDASDVATAEFVDASVLSLASALVSLATLAATAPATLTADKPEVTDVDEAGDMTAAKVGDPTGTAITA